MNEECGIIISSDCRFDSGIIRRDKPINVQPHGELGSVIGNAKSEVAMHCICEYVCSWVFKHSTPEIQIFGNSAAATENAP